MNCIVLLFPGSATEQGTLLKHLGELGACFSVEQSQSAILLQILEKFINSSSNPNLQKEAEKSFSADSSPVADQHTNSHREGSKECTSNGSEDLAGEAHQGVKSNSNRVVDVRGASHSVFPRQEERGVCLVELRHPQTG